MQDNRSAKTIARHAKFKAEYQALLVEQAEDRAYLASDLAFRSGYKKHYQDLCTLQAKDRATLRALHVQKKKLLLKKPSFKSKHNQTPDILARHAVLKERYQVLLARQTQGRADMAAGHREARESLRSCDHDDPKVERLIWEQAQEREKLSWTHSAERADFREGKNRLVQKWEFRELAKHQNGHWKLYRRPLQDDNGWKNLTLSMTKGASYQRFHLAWRASTARLSSNRYTRVLELKFPAVLAWVKNICWQKLN